MNGQPEPAPAAPPPAKDYWTVQDVAAWLGLQRNRPVSIGATQVWMWRHKVRRASADRRLTRKEWVMAAMERKRKPTNQPPLKEP